MAAEGAFASLYYTDCLPGQGLRGAGGFGFQAVSPGVDDRVLSVVQESALYEPPPEWMRRRRPVRDYPPALAHVFDGGYVTAQGVYLGTEANGSRQGNQFTHAISTTDPAAYGQLRPAQLWRAPWWAGQPAATTSCDPVDGEPDSGPLRTETVHAWLTTRSGAKETLTAFVSALHGLRSERPRRIAFIADEPDTVLRWLVAGTLLLPQRAALRVSFRVFASNISYSRHEVLAVHLDWAGSVQERGFVVFDLVAGTHAPVEPTPAALFWVPRFLRGDPLDVVDAVELADRFGGPGESDGDRLAASVLVLGDTVRTQDEVRALAAWVRRQPARVVAEVGQAIATAVLGAEPDAMAVGDLVGALTGHAPVTLTSLLRRDLRDAELNALLRLESWQEGTAFVAALPPVSPDSVGDAADATSRFEKAVALARPEQVDALLRLATRHRVPVRPSAFAGSASAFAQWWSYRPDLAVQPQNWSCAPEMLDLLKDALGARLSDPRTLDHVHTHWWRLLWRTVTDPSGGIDAELTAAALASRDEVARHAMITHVAAHVHGPGDAEAWRALFRLAPPEDGELVAFLGALPRDHTVSDAFAKLALAAVATGGRPSARLLDVLRLLADRKWQPTEHIFARWAGEDELLARWVDAIRYPNRVGCPSRQEMDAVGELVIGARADTVVEMLNTAVIPAALDAMFNAGWALHRFLLGYLRQTLGVKNPPPGANTELLGMLALEWQWSGRLAPAESEDLLTVLQRWTSRLDHDARQRIGLHLTSLDRTNGELWPDWLHKFGARGRRRRFRR